VLIRSRLLRDEMDWYRVDPETGFRINRKKTCMGAEVNTRRYRFMGIEGMGVGKFHWMGGDVCLGIA
jgi:hypothetical protein